MDLRTNPRVPVISNQPTPSTEMRYISPRAMFSDNSQNGAQIVRRDYSEGISDGAGSLPSPIFTSKTGQTFMLAKLTLEPTKLDDPFPEVCKMSVKSGHDEMRQDRGRSSSLSKATASKTSRIKSETSLRDATPLRSNRGTAIAAARSCTASRESQHENGNRVRSSSVYSLTQWVPPKEMLFKQRAESKLDSKGKGKEIQYPIDWSRGKNDERSTSDTTISVVLGSSLAKSSKKEAKNATAELSYIHDFSDCSINKNILEYYEQEEKQASQHHAPYDCIPCFVTSASYPKIHKLHSLNDCSLASLGPHQPKRVEQHALDDCSRTSSTSIYTSKISEQQALQDCLKKDSRKDSLSINSEPHPLPERPVESVTSEAVLTDAQTHNLVDKSKDKNLTGYVGADPRNLLDCPEKVSSGSHVLFKDRVEHDNSESKSCGRTDNGRFVETSATQPHDLADCAHESVSSSTTEQHALAECRGDGDRKGRRASSNPDSPTEKFPQLKQHRLASCPASTPYQRGETAKTDGRVVENARLDGSADSQSTVKPSKQHSLIGYTSDASLESLKADVDGPPRKESSVNSLLAYADWNQDTADHPRKSRYRKEVDKALFNASEVKRQSQAQQALSQILGGNRYKKGNFQESSLDTIKGAVQSVADEFKKRAHGLGEAAENEVHSIQGEAKKRAHGLGEAAKKEMHSIEDEIKKRVENIGDEVKNQTDKVGRVVEHENSVAGFASLFSKMSPKLKA